MISSYRKVEGGWQGVVKEPEGWILWACPHIHNGYHDAADCAYDHHQGVLHDIEEEDAKWLSTLT